MLLGWAYENFSAVWVSVFFGVAVLGFYQLSNTIGKFLPKTLTAADWMLLGFWVFSGVGFLVATDLIFLFIFLVAFNICMYTLMLSSKTKASAEATSKYLLFSSLSISSLLFGVFAYYCEYGTLNISTISVILNEASWVSETITFWEVLGGAFIIFAITVKLGAFPGFLWSADVYDGVSTGMLMLVLISKIFIFSLLVKFYNIFGVHHVFVWGPLLSIFGCGSLIAGTFGAVMQQRLKRFLAFSSINHVGFGLIALSTEVGNSLASLGYIVVYVLSSLVLVVIINGVRGVVNNRALTYVSDLSVLVTKDRVLGWIFIFMMFSLAGIPPFLGFFTKYSVLVTCASSVFAWGFASFLIAVCLLPIASFNYLRVIKNMLFRGYFSSVHASTFYVTIGFISKAVLVVGVFLTLALPTTLLVLVNENAGCLGLNSFINTIGFFFK